MSGSAIKQISWFCPECGSEDHENGGGGSKYCSVCGQEWFSDVNYSEALQENIKNLSEVVCAATNDSMPHVAARNLKPTIDRLTAERDDAIAAADFLELEMAKFQIAADTAKAERDAAVADAERYRKLRKLTPYRFKKIQDEAIIDAVDVKYFHADIFDAGLDATIEEQEQGK